MKIHYKTNFVGYISVLRGILLLLREKDFGFTQLGAYIAFVMQADFDKRHSNYRLVIRDDKELAKAWGCSLSTIHRRRKELIKLGLLEEKDGITEVTNYYLFDKEFVRLFAKLTESTLKGLFATSHKDIENEEYFIAEMQKKSSQNTPQSSNFPSKGELGLSEEDISYINDSLGGNKEE
ncbi:hypothetical protein KBC14_01645 [Candidatus Woesebacteria bacterium]|jgi:hypothetical protein|nr:hypothetical protein [Candidatus Woesebacteria bacterium]MBP6883075.1 hypothetical protein [Candidatus Woesebacteria bacterium]